MNQQHCTHTLKGGDVVSTLCFVRDNRLLTGYIGGQVSVFHCYFFHLFIQVNMFDLNKGAPTKLAHSWNNHSRYFFRDPIFTSYSNITSIILTNRGRKAVFLSRDQTLSIVDIETREKLKVFHLILRNSLFRPYRFLNLLKLLL